MQSVSKIGSAITDGTVIKIPLKIGDIGIDTGIDLRKVEIRLKC